MASRIALFAGLSAVAVPLVLLGAQADSAAPTASFAGTASADGVRVTVNIPGGPLVDRLVDIGGPTAQVSVSTLGTSTAYAALPDPGQLVNSGPGLVVGILAQGAYGLPPLKLPPLPVQQVDPLEVLTDANGKQTGSLGAGPYAISARSAATTGSADATGGLVGATSIAGLRSHSDVSVAADGAVTASATATVTGLKLGPITIGSIVSTASETLGADGKIVSHAATGLSIFTLNGVPLPLKIPLLDLSSSGATATLTHLLAPLLKPLGITMEFNQITSTPGTVTAPTLSFSMPFNTGKSGLSGTASVTFGGTTATMAGSIIAPDSPPVQPSYTPQPVNVPTAAVPTVSIGVIGPPVTTPTPSAPSPTTSPVLVARSTGLLGVFNIKALYLVLVALGVVVVLISQLIRRLGVRA